jgi:hypothetical protein
MMPGFRPRQSGELTLDLASDRRFAGRDTSRCLQAARAPCRDSMAWLIISGIPDLLNFILAETNGKTPCLLRRFYI